MAVVRRAVFRRGTVVVLLCVACIGTSGVGTAAPSSTCAVTPKGRDIGCLESLWDCDAFIWWREGSRWYLTRDVAEKDLELRPPATVMAVRLGRGRWRILDLPSKRVLGAAVATNPAASRWRITNRAGALVARAGGPEGPPMAMILLTYGARVFC